VRAGSHRVEATELVNGKLNHRRAINRAVFGLHFGVRNAMRWPTSDDDDFNAYLGGCAFALSVVLTTLMLIAQHVI
jgi:hypothetical protein